MRTFKLDSVNLHQMATTSPWESGMWQFEQEWHIQALVLECSVTWDWNCFKGLEGLSGVAFQRKAVTRRQIGSEASKTQSATCRSGYVSHGLLQLYGGCHATLQGGVAVFPVSSQL